MTINCFIIKSFGLLKKFGGCVRLPHGMNGVKAEKIGDLILVSMIYFFERSVHIKSPDELIL